MIWSHDNGCHLAAFNIFRPLCHEQPSCTKTQCAKNGLLGAPECLSVDFIIHATHHFMLSKNNEARSSGSSTRTSWIGAFSHDRVVRGYRCSGVAGEEEEQDVGIIAELPSGQRVPVHDGVLPPCFTILPFSPAPSLVVLYYSTS